MRIIGLDYGDKTIGVAVSDMLGWTAQGLETIRRQDAVSLKKSMVRLAEIVKEYGVDTIVLGYPKNMDNSEGERCQKTLEFKTRLETAFPTLEIVLQDERMSTISAQRVLIEADMSRKKRGQVIDKTAAVFILQNYLDKIAKNK